MKLNNGLLMTVQEVSKVLGVPKKAVQDMVAAGTLLGVSAGTTTYITKQSLTGILGQKEQVNFGQQERGYPVSEELSSPLTNNQLGNDNEKVVVSMVYKGSISALADGRFMVQIDKGKKADGKRDRESKSFRDKADADKYLKNRLTELNAPVAAPTAVAPFPTIPNIPQGNYTTLTFEEYALGVLENGIGNGTSRTMEDYRVGLKYVVDIIGDLPMVNITKKDINKVFKKLCPLYAQSNITRTYNALKIVIEDAYEEGHILMNPMRKMECPKSTKPIEEKSPIYSDEDIKLLFKTSKEYQPELYTMFVLLECTGMRPAEMRALEWSSFDRKNKTIYIKQAATYEYEEIKSVKKRPKAKEIISTTKSKYGVRMLQLSDLAVQALLDWEKIKHKSRSKANRESKYIFNDRKGSFKTETSCQSKIQRYREKYGITEMGVRFYKFRHTMCTRLVMAGQPTKVIQSLLGDNTTDVIMEVYTHINQEMARQSAQPFYEDLNKKHTEMAG